MEEKFFYAHRDPEFSEGHVSYTRQFNAPRLPEQIQRMRQSAVERQIPVSGDETLCFLLAQLAAVNPSKILEVGTAVGATACAMLNICKNAHLTTIERESDFCREAEQNFAAFGVADRVNLICGDAGEVLKTLNDGYDFIFLDCAKVAYVKYLPVLKGLLRRGGTLLADDVLLYGYVSGEVQTPKKRQSLVNHIREYINAVLSDDELCTVIVNIGDGAALSVKL